MHSYCLQLFAYKAFTFSGCSFQNIRLNCIKLTGSLYQATHISHYTVNKTHTGLQTNGLGSSHFAHHYFGNHFVFFSWPYLDVSVRTVHPAVLYIQTTVIQFCCIGFPHSDISGSKLDWQLPEAFGSLPPPSSLLDAKASTKYPY